MKKREQISNIRHKVESLVDTNTTITNLKKYLDKCGVFYLDKFEWEELVCQLEMYYIISDKSYPYEIVESYLEDLAI